MSENQQSRTNALRDLQENSSAIFDFKGFLFKLLKFWPLFVVSLVIAFAIAHYVNVRKLPVYGMSNLISIKDDQNPFFTSNTSLTFNWGGTTDKVNTAIINLKSRSHNEKVVDYLQYYINYQQDGEYQKVDAYGFAPFKVSADTSGYQALGQEFVIVFKDSVTFNFSTVFKSSSVRAQKYSDKTFKNIAISTLEFRKNYRLGEKINLPFFKGIFFNEDQMPVTVGKPYYISFTPFDAAVKRYLSINVNPESKGSSVLKLALNGTNKNRLVEYLNSSVEVLSRDLLERKNLFATKTIRFIDSSLQNQSKALKDVEKELSSFKNNNAIFDLEAEGVKINTRLTELELTKESLNREINYYNVLEDYLTQRKDYSDVPAPSVAGIEEASIVSGVGRIIILAEERQKLEYSFRPGAPVFADIDRRIDAVKNVLLENLRSTKAIKNQELREINRDVSKYESEIRKLPKEQQELLKIERRYTISEGTYNIFLAKRSEAGLVKAANVSDVLMVDPAKDTGGNQIGPDMQLNYVLAAFFGSLIPFGFVLLLAFFDNKVSSTKDIERLSPIPVLGVVGKSTLDTNLAVLTMPKSAVAESFRAIRSSLQFMYKKQGVDGAKTVLVTSTVSGEGKTFTSINIASVFALSGKKTVLVGLDLRKPKIFDDFKVDKEVGVVNYLIKEASLEEITQKTQIPSLDVIVSGPIPPNPSELLMGDEMALFVAQLKEKYEYIILDSPPLGLVADAQELTKYVDASLYLVRQNYTKKGMFGLVNEKYRRGEIKNISFVLNFFKNKGAHNYGYGYSYGYGYGNYGNGYHEDEKKLSLLDKLKRILKK